MTFSAAAESRDILRRLGVPEAAFADVGLATLSPIDGSAGACVVQLDPEDIDAAVARSVGERAARPASAKATSGTPRRRRMSRLSAAALRVMTRA